MAGPPIKAAKLSIRLSAEAKNKLQAAAESDGRTLSDFVLESALAAAEGTLADRNRFGLNAEAWKAFNAALEAPPRDLTRLNRMFLEPSIFERQAPE